MTMRNSLAYTLLVLFTFLRHSSRTQLCQHTTTGLRKRSKSLRDAGLGGGNRLLNPKLCLLFRLLQGITQKLNEIHDYSYFFHPKN